MSGNKNTIGSMIKRFRAINDFTQEELAQKLQISAQTIMEYESGKSEPPFALIKKLHKVLSIPSEILFEESDSIHTYVNSMEDKLVKHIESIEILEKNPGIEKFMKEYTKNSREHLKDKTLKLLDKIIKIPGNERKEKYALLNKVLNGK